MRRLGFIGLLIPLLIAGVAGVIGYNWGYSDGALRSAADGATVVYARGFGGGGFGIFGLLFGLFLLFFLFSLIRRAVFGWGGGMRRYGMYGYGRGGWGHGYWHGDGGTNPGTPGTPGTPASAASGRPQGVPPFVEGMLQDWHANAHNSSSSNASPSTPPSGGPSPA